MKHKLCGTALVLAFFSVGGPALAFDDDPAKAAVLQPPGGDRLAPGVRVRVTTADLVEIPGVARIGRGWAQGRNIVVDKEHQIVTVSAAGTSDLRLNLPRPQATFVGQVVSAEDGTLVISLEGKAVEVTIPRAAVVQLDVSLGRSKRSGRGVSALGGMAIGGAAGMVVGLASGDDKCSPGEWCLLTFSATDKAVMYGVPLAVLGGIIGALTGGGKGERWERVQSSSSSKAKVTVRPLGRMGLSVSVGF
jgi:hypothetical protein